MTRRTYLRKMLGEALAETGYTVIGPTKNNEIPPDHVAYVLRTTKRQDLSQNGQHAKEGELSFLVVGRVYTGVDTRDGFTADDAANEMIERIEIALEGFDCDPYRMREEDYSLNVSAIDIETDAAFVLEDGNAEVVIRGVIAYTRVRL